MDQHGIESKRGLDGAHDRQFFVFDLHEFSGVLCRIAVVRHDDGHTFTDKAHAVDRHRFASDRLKTRLFDIRRQRANSSGEIAAGVDRVHARDL